MAIKFNTGRGMLEIESCVPADNVSNEYIISGRLLTRRSSDSLSLVPRALMRVFGDSPLVNSHRHPIIDAIARVNITHFSACFSPDRIRLQSLTQPSGAEPMAATATRFLTGTVVEALRTDQEEPIKRVKITQLARQAQDGGIADPVLLLKKSFHWGKNGLPEGLVVEEGRTAFDILQQVAVKPLNRDQE